MGSILAAILDIYIYIIIAYVVFSWLFAFNIVNPRNQIVSTIYEFCWKLVDPPLAYIRQVLPSLGGIDLSPIILLLGVHLLRGVVIGL